MTRDTRSALEVIASHMSEVELLNAVLARCDAAGWLAWHAYSSKRSRPGFPDVVAVGPDRVVYRELKTETGRTTEDQRRWLERLAKAGQDAGVWRPTQLLDGTVDRALGLTQSRGARP